MYTTTERDKIYFNILRYTFSEPTCNIAYSQLRPLSQSSPHFNMCQTLLYNVTLSEETCVGYVDGSSYALGCKCVFQVSIRSAAPNVTGTHYVVNRQVFAAKTLKQITSFDTQAVKFLNPLSKFRNF